MELRAEGAGKSYPPGHYGSLGARTDICDRLIDKGHEEEAIYNIDFRKQLDAHFDRLPSRYLLDMNVDKAEDVLLHQKLLAKARDPEKRPVFHCRFVKNIQIEIFKFETDENDDLQQIRVPSTSRGLSNTEQEVNMPSNIRQDLSHVIVHEIIFSTADQPKLLSQLSVLLSGIGLNIREAFVFSTTDGYSLDIFFVDGWPEEATDSLDNALEQAIARNEWLFSVSCHRVLENVISGQPSCDWEIDIKLLKIGEKIASVSCGDLYHGLYLGEDVAVKVFRLKQLNQPLKVEFNKEFSILRFIICTVIFWMMKIYSLTYNSVITAFGHSLSECNLTK
uniref:[Protein-PII] uridylyltransferase n=1 Tax=Anthurium amnicola TaxID=1678845 RepID=A0A1D1Y2N4_9ARAE